METAIMWTSLVVGVVAVALSLVSIWLARLSVKDSQLNFEKTSEVLAKINERAAGTEKVVGEHFDKLMGTVLNIVNATTTGPEVRKAEVEAKEKEGTLRLQDKMMGILSDALQSGDEQKIKNFVAMAEQLSKLGKAPSP